MIRLYGPSVGNSSFARVASGMRDALIELDHFAGFVPIDTYDEEAVYPGHDADVGVIVAPPVFCSWLTNIGWHKKRFALVSANSSWLPQDTIRAMERHVTGFFAPSHWAAKVLRQYTELEVRVWRHGLASAFVPSATDKRNLLDGYDEGHFVVLHLSSTRMQRKGTRELIWAWCEAVKKDLLGRAPLLRLVVDAPEGFYKRDIEQATRGDARVPLSIVEWRSLNLSPLRMAQFYREHHLVIQPSRGEAFGMVPLEARATGTVVCMTTRATGHTEHPPGRSVVAIRTGDEAAIDDGPGALAPEVSASDVLTTLVEAYRNWPTLSQIAQEEASSLAQAWSWTETTKKWLGG